MVNNKKLEKYLWDEISNLRWRSRAELFNKLTTETIESWISHHKIKEGHSIWSEKLQRNIWIEDD